MKTLIIANGPSAHSARLAPPLAADMTISVNDSWALFPSDVVLTADIGWWGRNHSDVPEKPERILVAPYKPKGCDWTWFEKGISIDIYMDGKTLCGLRSSAVAAINYAILKGSDHIILIGVDLEGRYQKQKEVFNEITVKAAHMEIDVVNCSHVNNIIGARYSTLEKELL